MTDVSADDVQSEPTRDEEPPVGPSTELVLADARVAVPAPGSWRETGLDLRSRLPELARHPAAVASASAAATIGAGFLLNVLRRAFMRPELPATGGADPLVIGAFVVQQVHIVQHVVHHRAD